MNLPPFVLRAFAQGTTGGGSVRFPNPLNETSLIGVVQKLITGLNLLAIPIVAIMVLIAGFQMVTAGGDTAQFEKGKKTLYYVVIGYIVILLAQGVVAIIKDILS